MRRIKVTAYNNLGASRERRAAPGCLRLVFFLDSDGDPAYGVYDEHGKLLTAAWARRTHLPHAWVKLERRGHKALARLQRERLAAQVQVPQDAEVVINHERYEEAA